MSDDSSPPPPAPGSPILCPLCGYTMTQAEAATCHPSCPLAAGCAMVRCPRCGAEFPRAGRVTRWLERLLRRK